MMQRRGFFGLAGALGAAMAFIPGGDRLPAGRRPDQRYNPPPKGSLASGSQAGTLRARQVIVSGANEGVFVYDGTPAAGNLIASITSADSTDPYGNSYLAGVSTYEQATPTTWIGTNINGPEMQFISATTHEGPWTATGAIVQAGGLFSTPGAVAVSQLTMQQGLGVPAPAAAGTLYVATDGSLHYVGPGGTDTKLAPS